MNLYGLGTATQHEENFKTRTGMKYACVLSRKYKKGRGVGGGGGNKAVKWKHSDV